MLGTLCLPMQSPALNTPGLFTYYNPLNYGVSCTLLFHRTARVRRLFYYLRYLFGILSLKKKNSSSSKKKKKKFKLLQFYDSICKSKRGFYVTLVTHLASLLGKMLVGSWKALLWSARSGNRRKRLGTGWSERI